jgi:hypothetical protein
MTTRTKRLDWLTAATEVSYSFDRYSSWRRVISKMVDLGWTDEQIIAVALSKWMRWAADQSNKPYGRVCAEDVMAYLVRLADKGELQKLTKEHWDSEVQS